MFYRFDDVRQYEGRDIWWMSFPKIESRKIITKPFGPPPKFKVNDKIRFREKPDRVRKMLKVEWHKHRYQWVYIVETSASDEGQFFEPYWFDDKLEFFDD